VLLVGVAGTILTFFSSVVTAITFTSVFIIILYALIAIAAIVHRFSGGHHHTPYKMVLWPLPPVVALVGVLLALYFQTRKDIITCIVIFIVGLLLYFWAARHKTGFWRRTPAGE
jgi:amino acid transporter